MYSFTSRVRFSETDESGHLSLTGLMNYLQDCCLFQSESLGVGPENLKERHRVWLLSGWQIVIDRYPGMFEKITVGTIPYAFTGCLGWRNVLILDEQGKCIVRANSPWVYLNTDTGRPERPDETEKTAYSMEERIQMEYAPRKIRLPEKMQDCEPIPVVRDFIDSNHHVNNARYVEIAADLAKKREPEAGFSVRELRAEYKRQAQLNDILYPRIGRQDDWEYVTLANRDGEIFASVALRE